MRIPSKSRGNLKTILRSCLKTCPRCLSGRGSNRSRPVPESIDIVATDALNNPCVTLTNEDIELCDGWSLCNRNYTYERADGSRMVEMLKMDAAYLLDACYKTNLLKALLIANRERVYIVWVLQKVWRVYNTGGQRCKIGKGKHWRLYFLKQLGPSDQIDSMWTQNEHEFPCWERFR